MENKIQELTDKIYHEGVEKETKKHRSLFKRLKKTLNKSLKMLRKKQIQSLPLLRNLQTSWRKILNQN